MTKLEPFFATIVSPSLNFETFFLTVKLDLTTNSNEHQTSTTALVSLASLYCSYHHATDPESIIVLGHLAVFIGLLFQSSNLNQDLLLHSGDDNFSICILLKHIEDFLEIYQTILARHSTAVKQDTSSEVDNAVRVSINAEDGKRLARDLLEFLRSYIHSC